MTAAPKADKRTMLRSLRRAVREGGALPSKSTTTCAHVSFARKLPPGKHVKCPKWSKLKKNCIPYGGEAHSDASIERCVAIDNLVEHSWCSSNPYWSRHHDRTHPRFSFGRRSRVSVQAGSFVVRTVYDSEGLSMPNCKVFACRSGLEKQR